MGLQPWCAKTDQTKSSQLSNGSLVRLLPWHCKPHVIWLLPDSLTWSHRFPSHSLHSTWSGFFVNHWNTKIFPNVRGCTCFFLCLERTPFASILHLTNFYMADSSIVQVFVQTLPHWEVASFNNARLSNCLVILYYITIFCYVTKMCSYLVFSYLCIYLFIVILPY